MSFKENLLKKIHIDNLGKTVLCSIGQVGSGLKIDKGAMRCLLTIGNYNCKKIRDLELYIKEDTTETPLVLVLDNELPLYHTTIDDVALRKSPFVKEMINIRNIIKILNDADVIQSRKEDTLAVIQQECIATLDLSYDEPDLADIEADGISSLEHGNGDGVIESISLFAELLGYLPPPRSLKFDDYDVFGRLSKKENGEIVYGPMILYNKNNNLLLCIDDQIENFNKEKIEYVHQIVKGEKNASKIGASVFHYLKESVMKLHK